MAKINHNSFVDTVNTLLDQAKKKGVLYLRSTDDQWLGSHMTLNNQELRNFGTCGYLGLETREELVERSKEFANQFGTQFSISRTYVYSKQNEHLEGIVGEIFDGSNALVFSSTTLAHFAIMPIVIGINDAIIVDRQAHFSMQTAMRLLSAQGVPTQLIRHNNLNMLEEYLIQLKDKHEKVWYVIDGVYSMYGDLPPYDELNELAKKYPQLHFYVDDAHGMSWHGKNGSGCTFEKFRENRRTILVTTMAKGFGSLGGIVVFPDDNSYQRVLGFGGPLSYSHPVAPSVMGASIASAEIHLSDEIYKLQNELQEKIGYCNDLLEKTEIPILSNPNTPIYFLGTGQPNVGFNMNKRMLDEGYYVNLGIFPAVSIKNTGLRFTITNHVSKKDIKDFVDALQFHYPKALQEEGKTLNDVRKAFRLPELRKKEEQKTSGQNLFELRVENSIEKIDKNTWDSCMKEIAGCSWDNLRMTEQIYTENQMIEENAEFLYYLVSDKETGEVVCCTFFSLLLLKDDMFEPANKSRVIEEKRQFEPYYLTSKTYFMGTMLSEGNHMYVNYNYNWKEALQLVLSHLSSEQEKNNANNVVFRDFSGHKEEFHDFMNDMGYARIDMPNSNIIEGLKGNDEESFFQTLSARNRRHIRNDVYRYSEELKTEVCDQLTDDEKDRAYELLLNVSQKNMAVNLFDYPRKLVSALNENPIWEFIKIRLNEEMVAIGFCYKLEDVYYPVLVGLDYEANGSHKVYKQMLYRVVMRALSLGCDKVCFGLSADTEKRKLRATQNPRVAYISVKDNFNFETINNLVSNERGSN